MMQEPRGANPLPEQTQEHAANDQPAHEQQVPSRGQEIPDESDEYRIRIQIPEWPGLSERNQLDLNNELRC